MRSPMTVQGAQRLREELDHLKSVTIAPVAASYLDGMHQALRLRRGSTPALDLRGLPARD